MNDSSSDQYILIDAYGLHSIATCQDHKRKELLLSALSSGQIRPCGPAWKDFKETYVDESEELLNCVHPIRHRDEYNIYAGQVADQQKPIFSIKPFGNYAEQYTVAAALKESKPILTTSKKTEAYVTAGCQIIAINDWLPFPESA